MRINIWGTFKLIKWWRWHCRLQWLQRSQIGDDFLFEITWKFLPDFGVTLIWTSFSVEGLRTDNLDFLFMDTVWFSGGSNFLLFIQQLLTCYPCLTLVARPLILQEPPPLLGHLRGDRGTNFLVKFAPAPTPTDILVNWFWVFWLEVDFLLLDDQLPARYVLWGDIIAAWSWALLLGWGSHPGCGWEALLGSLLEGKHRQKSSFPESNRRFNCDKCTNVSETNKYLNDHIIKYHYNSKSERIV